jgi:chaperonin GroEL
MSYNPKDLYFDAEARNKLLSGIRKLSKAVKSTMGPRGNTVLIESINHTKGMTVTKDGATVARAVELLDPVENLACKMMREASDITAREAGDGSSTSIVLTEALIKAAMATFSEHPELNRAEVLRKLNDVCEEYVEAIKSKSTPLTEELLESVATISANNDSFIGGLVAEAYSKVGKGGVVHYEKSNDFDTYIDVINGMKLSVGYQTPMFANNVETDTFNAANCYVLVCDQDINNFAHQFRMELLEELAKHRVLFVAPFSNAALAVIVGNAKKLGLQWCVVPPPMTGYRQKEAMQDLAVALGAKYISQEAGDDMSLITIKDFGLAKSVTVSDSQTIIIPSEEKVDKEQLQERITQLHGAFSRSKKAAEKKFIEERIGMLNGKIGVIYAGGNDMEQKELYDRIEDSVLAVKSAVSQGILPGAGRALDYISTEKYKLISGSHDLQPEYLAAHKIMQHAVGIPIRQILLNAGLEYDKIYSNIEEFEKGYNLKTGKAGNLINMGVVDPTKVTITALENAVRVATTIASTNAVLTMARAES